MLCLEGQLVENIYDVNEEGEPQIQETKILTPGAITYMHDSIGFHTISNETDATPAVTLHCYHPPYDHTSSITKEGDISMMP